MSLSLIAISWTPSCLKIKFEKIPCFTYKRIPPLFADLSNRYGFWKTAIWNRASGRVSSIFVSGIAKISNLKPITLQKLLNLYLTEFMFRNEKHRLETFFNLALILHSYIKKYSLKSTKFLARRPGRADRWPWCFHWWSCWHCVVDKHHHFTDQILFKPRPSISNSRSIFLNVQPNVKIFGWRLKYPAGRFKRPRRMFKTQTQTHLSKSATIPMSSSRDLSWKDDFDCEFVSSWDVKVNNLSVT